MSSIMHDLKDVEDRLVARIHELEHNVAELDELRDVARRLGIDPAERLQKDGRMSPPGTRHSTRTRHAAVGHAAVGQRQRRTTRRDRVLKLVGGTPGISVPELVEEMGVNRTSLYPVIRQLVSDGMLDKRGPQLFPVVA